MSNTKLILAKSQFKLQQKNEKKENSSFKNIVIEIIDFITKSTINSSDFKWEDWNIGLTVYPNQEKREQGKPSFWKSWKANSSFDALKVQKYFTDKYPININRKNGQYDYFIYIFKK